MLWLIGFGIFSCISHPMRMHCIIAVKLKSEVPGTQSFSIFRTVWYQFHIENESQYRSSKYRATILQWDRKSTESSLWLSFYKRDLDQAHSGIQIQGGLGCPQHQFLPSSRQGNNLIDRYYIYIKKSSFQWISFPKQDIGKWVLFRCRSKRNR